MIKYIMSEKLGPLWQKRHAAIHHPVVNGQEVTPIPYLTLPFRKEDLIEAAQTDSDFNRRRLYDITEGWMYSAAERAIHGYKVHAGVDYYTPYGTPVAAPCDGYAVSSYFSFPLTDEQGKPKIYQGKSIAFGLGYFVQVYNPELNRFVVMGHLSDIAGQVPYSKPVFSEGTWTPVNHNLPIAAFHENPAVVPVKRGDIIGKVGFSGLRWGYEEYREGADRPIVLDPKIYKSYDEPHVHFDEYWRHQESGKKGWMRDPYDRYSTARNYPTPTRRRSIGPEPLLYLDENELPHYADSHINL